MQRKFVEPPSKVMSQALGMRDVFDPQCLGIIYGQRMSLKRPVLNLRAIVKAVEPWLASVVVQQDLYLSVI